MLSVLVADDHELLRRGVRDLVEANGWHVCAEASNGREAVACAREHQPSVAIVDVAMPEMNGIEAIRLIRDVSPGTHVLVFTGHAREEMATEALALGARGFMLKSDGCKILLAAMEELSKGGTFVTPGKRAACTWIGVRRTPVPRSLTPREREIVQLLAEGKTNSCIAIILNVSVRTVETHRAHILEKLGLESVVELVHYAIRNHMVET